MPRRRKLKYLLAVITALFFCSPRTAAQDNFTLEQILSAPFADNLIVAKTGHRVAWTLDDRGRRNIWVAEGPQFQARQLTHYDQDDGQALSSLQFSADSNSVIYVRGEGKNPAGQSSNPTSNPSGAEQAVWSIPWSGGDSRKIDAGNSPQVSSREAVAYIKDDQLWLASPPAFEKPIHIVTRGKSSDPQWSADGQKLAFVSTRGDHAFIAIYSVAEQRIDFLSPSVDRDDSPRWAPDSRRIAFVRRPAVPRDSPEGFFVAPDKPEPWSVWLASLETLKAKEIWRSGKAVADSLPEMADETGGGTLNWAAGNRLVLASEKDGWQHLYSLSADGGTLALLTPGNCEVEQWSFTADKSAIIFNSNCGDIDRRHLWRANTSGSALPEQLTHGDGIEWSAQAFGDGKGFAYLAADTSHPSQLFISGGTADSKPQSIGPSWPESFSHRELVAPEPATFRAADGVSLHAQIFSAKAGKDSGKHPAVIFLHGGPMRQMLLGWHYMYYYSNAYAMNQYLASRGYVVLALNYRSGIGYGREFHNAPGRAGRGASEYQDVVAAAKYLASRPDIDPHRIGLWGGSYGGYLTALSLARNSDLFAAGVDLHGVHDWPVDNWDGKNISAELNRVAHEASPVTAVDSWRSPVLFIHGDDDRNVYFAQTVDLVARLRAKGVEIEQLIFPDEVHDFLLHRDWLAAYQAASEFFDRHLKAPAK